MNTILNIIMENILIEHIEIDNKITNNFNSFMKRKKWFYILYT